MKMDLKNFLGNYGRIRENFGRLKIAEFSKKFSEFKMGFLNCAIKNSAKFLNLLNLTAKNSKALLNSKANLAKLLNFKAKNSMNLANLLDFTAKMLNFKATPEFQGEFKAKNSSITKKGLLYENENPA